MYKIVDLLVEYLKDSNWDEDGFPSNDDSYYKVVQIKTARSISEIKEDIEDSEWCDELVDSQDVIDIFNLPDYVEDTLRVIKVLSEVGHEM